MGLPISNRVAVFTVGNRLPASVLKESYERKPFFRCLLEYTDPIHEQFSFGLKMSVGVIIFFTENYQILRRTGKAIFHHWRQCLKGHNRQQSSQMSQNIELKIYIDTNYQNSCLFKKKGKFSSSYWVFLGVLAKFHDYYFTNSSNWTLGKDFSH